MNEKNNYIKFNDFEHYDFKIVKIINEYLETFFEECSDDFLKIIEENFFDLIDETEETKIKKEIKR